MEIRAVITARLSLESGVAHKKISEVQNFEALSFMSWTEIIAQNQFVTWWNQLK